MLPQVDFCHFLDIFQDIWQPLKCGVDPLFVETSLTPASHTPDLYVCEASGKTGLEPCKPENIYS